MLSGLGGSGFLSRSGFLRENFSLRALCARATQGTHRIPRFSSHYMYHNILHHDFLDVSVGVSVCTCVHLCHPVKFLFPVSFLTAFSYLAMGRNGGGTGFLTLAAPKSGTRFLNVAFS